MLQRKFKQAVSGRSPRVLKALLRDEVNLAVWKDPLSAESKKYLEKVSLKGFVKGRWWRDGFGASGKGIERMPTLAEIKRVILRGLPRGRGKEALARDILKLHKEFLKVTGRASYGMQAHVFRPSKHAGFWHTDAEDGVTELRGVITLVGDRGMLWRPDHTLPRRGRNRLSAVWGRVNPGRGETIEEVAPQDFAAIKCRLLPNPLVHATPDKRMSKQRRLVLIMSARGRG